MHPPRALARQDGKFCPTSQPAWSAFREASFGFGMLEVLNATHATWEWKRDAGLGGGQGKDWVQGWQGSSEAALRSCAVAPWLSSRSATCPVLAPLTVLTVLQLTA